MQKLYLSGTRKKRGCSPQSCMKDVIGKTRAGKFYLPRTHFKPAPRTSSKPSVGRSIRRAGARLLRRPQCSSVARACLGSGRGVRRCKPDRRRANCDAESVQQRWPRDIGASGERGDVRQGGPRCFRRYKAPRSGAPTGSPTSEVLLPFELLRGVPPAARRGATACPRLASSGSVVSCPVSHQGEWERHGEHCGCGALAC